MGLRNEPFAPELCRQRHLCLRSSYDGFSRGHLCLRWSYDGFSRGHPCFRWSYDGFTRGHLCLRWSYDCFSRGHLCLRWSYDCFSRGHLCLRWSYDGFSRGHLCLGSSYDGFSRHARTSWDPARQASPFLASPPAPPLVMVSWRYQLPLLSTSPAQNQVPSESSHSLPPKQN